MTCLLRDWADLTADALIALRPDGGLDWQNAAARALVGEVTTDVLAALMGILDGEGTRELVLPAASGPVRVEVHLTRMPDAIVLRLGPIEDRSVLEDELHRLASFPELHGGPVIETDARGNLTYANEAADAVLDRFDFAGLVAGLPAPGPAARPVIREVGIDGRWWEFAVHGIGKWDCYRIYGQDVTERKQAELALMHARDELELRVAERTEAVGRANEELQRQVEAVSAAEERAIAASQAKSSFLANMSHELRTPLNAIIGYTELMIEESGGGPIVEDLGKVEGAARHLLGLINDILDLSKIEAGKVELLVEDVDVDALIREVATTMEGLVATSGNRLDLVVGQGPIARVDRGKLRQVLLNLMSNAVKFTHAGQITVTASREADGRVRIDVADTGIGIPEASLERLFQPFTQANASTTRKYGGTGLGLAISQRFVQMMGGAIAVTTREGEGSTFTVWLPSA